MILGRLSRPLAGVRNNKVLAIFIIARPYRVVAIHKLTIYIVEFEGIKKNICWKLASPTGFEPVLPP
jgi:hypothetical protein